MRVKNIIALFFCIFTLAPAPHAKAFTTDELLNLKKAGISEELILFMVENDYQEADKIIKLKGADFKDETLMAIIKSDIRQNPRQRASAEAARADMNREKVAFETTAKMKILWHMIYRGEPIVQNSEEMNEAKISFLSDKRIKFEWKNKGGLGLLDAFLKKPFKSPFYWEINKSDSLYESKDGFPYTLKSTVEHKGMPDTDGKHYWIIRFEPKDPKIADYIREALL